MSADIPPQQLVILSVEQSDGTTGETTSYSAKPKSAGQAAGSLRQALVLKAMTQNRLVTIEFHYPNTHQAKAQSLQVSRRFAKIHLQ